MKSGTSRVMRAVEEECVSFSLPATDEDDEDVELAVLPSADSLVNRSKCFSATKNIHRHTDTHTGGVQGTH